MIIARFVLLVAVLCCADLAAAQRAGQRAGQLAGPAMREKVYQLLSAAQACVEQDDYPCARARLADVSDMDDLNSYERAQRWNFEAYIHFAQDDIEAAAAAYENVLAEPEVPLGMQRSTLYAMAQLYSKQEEYARALEVLDRWFAMTDEPSADPFVLRAQLLYQSEAFDAGLAPIQRAIDMATQRGDDVPEGWYQLLNVLHFHSDDDLAVIDTLETMIRLWPKREYYVQLAGMYGKIGNKARQLDLYEGAYGFGWLQEGIELVNLAGLLLEAEQPARAAEVLRRGIDDGVVEPSERSLELLREAERIQREAQKREDLQIRL